MKVQLLFSSLLIILSTVMGHKALSQGISYQAVVRNSQGIAMSNQVLTTRFSLLQTAPTGTVEYQEAQSLTTNSQGLISTLFGNGQALQGSFANIQWGVNAKFLKVEVDLNDWQTIGIQPLKAVPYAIRAKEVESDGLQFKSPNGSCYKLQINDLGQLSSVQVPCD